MDKDGNATDSTVTVKIKTPAITVIYKETAASLTVGSKVTASDGKTYYVISNQLGTNSTKSSASASISARAAATDETSESDDESSTETTTTADLTDATSATTIDTGDEATDAVIEKFASDAYVRKFLKEVGITKYIQLYKAGTRPSVKIDDSGKSGTLKDKFLIVDEEGNKIAEFSQEWRYNELAEYFKKYKDDSIDTSSDESETQWFKNTFYGKEDDLRNNYEPNQFTIKTYESGTTKYEYQKRYYYDKYGEVGTNKGNLKFVQYFRRPTKINSIIFPYRYSYSGKDVNDYERTAYQLLRYTSSSYFYDVEFDKYTSRETIVTITARGIDVENNSPDYRSNNLTIKFNDSDVLEINAKLKDSSTSNYGTDTISATDETSRNVQIYISNLDSEKTLLKQKVTVNVNGTEVTETAYTLGDAISTYLSDYIQFSDETATVNGYTVPAKIYARANFPSTYTEVAGHDFLNVELVPVAAGDDSFKYVGIYDSTTGSDGETTYSDAFDECVANETPMTESSYVPSFATLYADNITSVADGTYTDKKENPFKAASAE